MSAPSATQSLAAILLDSNPPEAAVQDRIQLVQREVLTHSTHLKQPDFKSIHTRDLESLFLAYDEQFFAGHYRTALSGTPLHFRLAPRMTSKGGTTACYRSRAGEVRFEVSIAINVLFDGFGAGDRTVTVCGIECHSRLDALQRIFEHEMVHVGELLCWGASQCSAPRFQDIASRLFLHRSHKHALITRRERAAEAGIHPGSLVAFRFEGRDLTGKVNRITKRATVLVPDHSGKLYSDGSRYVVYYVPLAALRLVMTKTTS